MKVTCIFVGRHLHGPGRPLPQHLVQRLLYDVLLARELPYLRYELGVVSDALLQTHRECLFLIHRYRYTCFLLSNILKLVISPFVTIFFYFSFVHTILFSWIVKIYFSRNFEKCSNRSLVHSFIYLYSKLQSPVVPSARYLSYT